MGSEAQTVKRWQYTIIVIGIFTNKYTVPANAIIIVYSCLYIS